jgi:hypothetical protein
VAIYSAEEFASYVQSDVDTATTVLLRSLVTGLIEDVTGLDYDLVMPTATVKAVALEAAGRAYRNPNGVSSRTEGIGNYNYTDRWEASAELGVLLTDGDLARLRGVPRNRSVVLRVP